MAKEEELISILCMNNNNIHKQELLKILNKINDNELVGKNALDFVNNLNYFSKEDIIDIVLDYFKTYNLDKYLKEKIDNEEIKIYSKKDADGEILLKVARCRKIDDVVYAFIPLTLTLLDSIIMVHEITHFLILNNKYESKFDINNRYYSEIDPIRIEYDLYNNLLKERKYKYDLEKIYNYRKCVFQSHITRFINYLYDKKIITKEERIKFGIRNDVFSVDLSKTTDIDYSFRYVLAIKYIVDDIYKR